VFRVAHGAVLRLTRPGEVRTYMVDPQFAKRVDAKSAVCLVALAAGVGAYVRGIGDAVEAKISSEARSLVFDCIFPLLLTEYGKFWPNKPPEMFDYTKERDGGAPWFSPSLELFADTPVLPSSSMWMYLDTQVDGAAACRASETLLDGAS
jgi:hypothetical protein